MSEKPWLTDPKYGGMSEIAAQRSYEAWVRQGRKTLPSVGTVLPASDEEIARRKGIVEDLLADVEQSQAAAIAWSKEWRARQHKGFRGIKRKALSSNPRPPACFAP